VPGENKNLNADYRKTIATISEAIGDNGAAAQMFNDFVQTFEDQNQRLRAIETILGI
jgi:hypothetical protein